VTEYAKSAAAQLQNESNIGAITASFSAAWPDTPPPDEPGGARAANATARGPSGRQDFNIVSYFIGKVRATVSVRYNKAEDAPTDRRRADAPPKDAPPKDVPPKDAPPG